LDFRSWIIFGIWNLKFELAIFERRLLMKEYTVEVTEVIQRTPVAVSIRMERPGGFEYDPGQWGLFSLEVGDGLETRSLSFSSSPTEEFLEFTKGITRSAFSRAVQECKPGDMINLKGPAGVLVYKGGAPKVAFMAGGIGITPIRSMMKYLTDKGDPGQKTLLYACLSLEECAFLEEINLWESDDPGLTVIHTLEQPPEGWVGPVGFITNEMIEDNIPDINEQRFFVSGPPAMVGCVMACFADLNVPREKVTLEELTGYEGMV
jgi:ferredoxin-NADP reductase